MNQFVRLRTYMTTCIGLAVASAVLALTVSEAGMRIAWFACAVLAGLLAASLWTAAAILTEQGARITQLERRLTSRQLPEAIPLAPARAAADPGSPPR